MRSPRRQEQHTEISSRSDHRWPSNIRWKWLCEKPHFSLLPLCFWTKLTPSKTLISFLPHTAVKLANLPFFSPFFFFLFIWPLFLLAQGLVPHVGGTTQHLLCGSNIKTFLCNIYIYIYIYIYMSINSCWKKLFSLNTKVFWFAINTYKKNSKKTQLTSFSNYAQGRSFLKWNPSIIIYLVKFIVISSLIHCPIL
jgi:hypothetical protein